MNIQHRVTLEWQTSHKIFPLESLNNLRQRTPNGFLHSPALVDVYHVRSPGAYR